MGGAVAQPVVTTLDTGAECPGFKAACAQSNNKGCYQTVEHYG